MINEVDPIRSRVINLTGYTEPSNSIRQIFDTNSFYKFSISHNKKYILHFKSILYPSITQSANNITTIAGYKFYTDNKISCSTAFYSEAYVTNLDVELETDPLGKIPLVLVGDKHSHFSWGHDDSYIIYCAYFAESNQNYLVLDYFNSRVSSSKVMILKDYPLLMIDNHPYTNSSHNGLICLKIANTDPVTEIIQIEPVSFINKSGEKIAHRTYPGLLKNSIDDSKFMNLITGRLQLIEIDSKSTNTTNTTNTNSTNSTKGRISVKSSTGFIPIKSYSMSFTSKFILYKSYTKTSYMVNHSHFGYEMFLWDTSSGVQLKIFDSPVHEKVLPIQDSCIAGLRDFDYATVNSVDYLLWTVALDNGNPKEKVAHRDKLMAWKIDMTQIVKNSLEDLGTEIVRTTNRLYGTEYDFMDNIWLTEGSTKEKKFKVHRLIRPFEFKTGSSIIEPIFEFDEDDLYSYPGNPMSLTDDYFCSKIYYPTSDLNTIVLQKNGHCPDGVFPYISLYNIKEKTEKIIWECDKSSNVYQSPKKLIKLFTDYLTIMYTEENADRSQKYYLQHYYLGKNNVETQRRSTPFQVENYSEKNQPPMYSFINTKKVIIDHSFSYDSINGFTKENIKYTRADGLPLSATLYLPKNFKPSVFYKIFIWAYPQEYNSKKDVGQVRSSHCEFSRIGWSSPLFWLNKGYIVVNDCDMPILKGDGTDAEEANDTFIDQLKMNADAIIGYLKNRKLTDGKNINIGGHSYGAFMVANLLAHTNLFTCGIARSGAYNRTLTPFGFQNEDRTIWEAKDTYLNMSPFLFANNINTPIMLIHGQADTNPGTFTLQSERLFEALRGLGKEAKLVLLPYEGHSYEAKESILHMLAQMEEWLDKWNGS